MLIAGSDERVRSSGDRRSFLLVVDVTLEEGRGRRGKTNPHLLLRVFAEEGTQHVSGNLFGVTIADRLGTVAVIDSPPFLPGSSL